MLYHTIHLYVAKARVLHQLLYPAKVGISWYIAKRHLLAHTLRWGGFPAGGVSEAPHSRGALLCLCLAKKKNTTFFLF